jgi:hypothetical protein
LLNVGDFDTPAATITDCSLHFGGSITDNDADVNDTCITDGFNYAKEYRLIGDWDELFGTRVRNWAQARSLATTQN